LITINGKNNELVPSVDYTGNVYPADVIGNKSDTVGGDSLVSLMKSAGGSGSSHAILYTGVIYYADAGQADDTGDGLTPETAKKTIKACITLMSAGDRVVVKAGTYDENGLDMNLAGMEMVCEANALLVNTTPGTVLTVSGAGCVVDGAHFVQAGAAGLVVSGIGVIVKNCIAVNCTVGFDINQHSTQLFNCVSAGHTVTGYDIGERNTVLKSCFAAGSGGATRGYYLSAAADTRCLLDGCHSVGNGTAGFELVASTTRNSLVNCSAGGGDGRLVDAGTNNTISNYTPNEHALQFTGTVWYVDGTDGADTNDGLAPFTAKATIGAALALMAAGDRVIIKTGTYDEDNLDFTLAGMEVVGEIGAKLVNTVGTECLTISGNHCRVEGLDFEQAGVIGLVLSGDECNVTCCRADTTTVGFDINGAKNVLRNCQDIDSTVTGFDIATADNLLQTCTSIANGAGSSRGFYLSNAAADENILLNCHSLGNVTAGFEVVAGANYNKFANCTSGGGDGIRVDAGTYNTWPGYAFDDQVNKDVTFAGATTEYNLFQLTGAVRLVGLIGHVETLIANTASNIHIELYSTGGTADLTDSPGPSVQALVAGAILVRNSDSTNNLDIGDPDGTPVVVENTNFRDPKTAVDIIADDTNTTYVRLVISVALASGKIHWHAKWEPLTENGNLVAV
jgi:hypothetical protein